MLTCNGCEISSINLDLQVLIYEVFHVTFNYLSGDKVQLLFLHVQNHRPYIGLPPILRGTNSFLQELTTFERAGKEDYGGLISLKMYLPKVLLLGHLTPLLLPLSQIENDFRCPNI